ncbi:hypothetical protein GLYMA_12G204800v4 [Glycine max]|uniref:Uncharacterized protein n=1 Tax=Glycine max TaxID=3847 RepID=K7LW32_SOYBN|nr:hypothetical protein JHK85_035213 [Glycine max]KAH1144141.1 hypothetical protein GYH30_034389 [Glycine max]KHN27893.1 hypothetical protein glysoja_007625 [Glycine soja]KRH26954.1 hypothetical protein GLYMA_12G204800v4 [Glycine max]
MHSGRSYYPLLSSPYINPLITALKNPPKFSLRILIGFSESSFFCLQLIKVNAFQVHSHCCQFS